MIGNLWIDGRWWWHGGDMFTLLMEYELGDRAAFDLFHHDDTVFGVW